MAIENKYRVHEVAKDFKMSTKEISDILTKYSKIPKNHMQVLTEEELNKVFDFITLKYQTEDLEGAINQQLAKKAARPKPQKAEDLPKNNTAKDVKRELCAPIKNIAEDKKDQQIKIATPPPVKNVTADKKDDQRKIVPPSPRKKTMARPASPHAKKIERIVPNDDNSQPLKIIADDEVITNKKPVHRIDTRDSINVDLSKYDDRIDALVPDKANKFGTGSNKQKIVKKSDARKPFGQKKRLEDQERLKRLQFQQMQAKKVQLKVMIPDEINVGELAARLKRTASDVIKELMKLGVMASISQTVDFDTASLVAIEMGAKVEREIFVTIEERLFNEHQDNDNDLIQISPVVVVMGHVDHGKTSLLDTIRKSDVAVGEAGGITQHIGAYRIQINGRYITFLDTPGHAAFTSMRARGAQVTDIAILVVAADDGIMPQTIEAINHAKAANIPIIVAINKIDKEGANPEHIMEQLTQYELVAEQWGGQTVVCEISAKKNIGIENLLEMVLLTSDVSELRANPNRQAKGTVIEAKLDKGRGPVATLLVQNGTLNSGDIIIAGTSVGRVRAMNDDLGMPIEHAGPSVPVEIIGLSQVPDAGDIFYAVEDERMARELAGQRRHLQKEERNNSAQKITLENLFTHIEDGNIKDFNIIVKADVQGSSEALKASLEKIKCDEVRVRVIHNGVGAINESDVMLASASGAILVGFNVRPEKAATESAQRQDIQIHTYRVIYDCIEEMEQAMKGMLSPKFKESIIGHAQIRKTFKVSGIGTIGGVYVQDGKILRNSEVRIVRDGIVIHEGKLNSLKRFKDDTKEALAGYECGLGIENYNDIKEGDIIESFVMEEIKQ